MIKIENVVFPSPEQWKSIIMGVRNPMNSWEKSDSGIGCDGKKCKNCGFKQNWCGNRPEYIIGENDLGLMKRLAKAGTDHRKFMRMITVYVDITAPLYWWKEFDTYRVGVTPNPTDIEMNSCSTMHKIHDKEFTLEDFSCEHLGVFIPAELNDGDECFQNLWVEVLKKTIEALNIARGYYNGGTNPEIKKKYWWQMIQLLPSSYNQKRTVMLNYEVLANMYKSRKDHKLDEWRDFCKWIETLPYSCLITGKETE